MKPSQICFGILFMAILSHGVSGIAVLARKLKTERTGKLRALIRQLSADNKRKRTPAVPVKKADFKGLKNKENFEVVRDFLSRDKKLNYRKKLQNISRKYTAKMRRLSLSSVGRLPPNSQQRVPKAAAKGRKLNESMIEDELIDFDSTDTDLAHSSSLAKGQKALENFRLIDSWVGDLEESLDDMRNAVNKKLTTLAMGVQQRNMLLGHYNTAPAKKKSSGL